MNEASDSSGASLPTASPKPVNPFRGTESFQTGDKIFGRDHEIDEFATRLLARRVVLLHSPSGAGKTSLVQAGLIPALNKKGLHILPKIRLNNLLPSDLTCNRYLASVFLSLDSGLGIPEGTHLSNPEIAALSLKPNGLVEYLETHTPYAKDTLSKFTSRKNTQAVQKLIFFDQFEEILTLVPTDPDVKRDFFARLAPVLNDYRIMAIFAMREEYVAGLEPYLIYFPERLSARFRLDLLNQPAALQAIRAPSQRVKVPFHPKAAEALVNELSLITVREAGQEKKISGLFVEPVQLQVVCRDLFERRADPHRITLEDVQKFGSVENALEVYYDSKIKLIAAGDKERERQLREWIESELIIAGSLRGQAAAGEEAKSGVERATVEKLIAAYLVREEPRRGVVWYELVHDSLVQPVIKSNAAWREVNASEFEIQAARWNKAPQEARDALLPAGEALRQAVNWGEAHQEHLTEIQKQYLSAAKRGLARMETRRDNRADLGINLEDTGWGVIFAADAPGMLREALKELLDHRRAQATRNRATYYREFFGADGYRPGETVQRFLARWEAGSGLANPEKMPYYLLIVGDPATIPFEFQYGLDVQYAVGRIYFETLEEYACYAHSVVLSETQHAAGNFDLPNRLVVFAPQHEDDRATTMAMNFLTMPILDALFKEVPNWDVERLLVGNATKMNLKQVLGGSRTPALLFTSAHGMHWPKAHPGQLDNQGALVCQDWPGPQHSTQKNTTYFFSAQDVLEKGNLLGTIIFSFGDNTAGTPVESNFDNFSPTKKQLAEKAFLARLPQRLLAHPQGGALAMVAHVDQAWSSSFQVRSGKEPTSDIGPIKKLLSRLMQGSTAGLAMEDINRRYSFFSTALADELVEITFYNQKRDSRELAEMLNQTIDARNYILIGDPAVRLPVRADQPYQAPPEDWQRLSFGDWQPPTFDEVDVPKTVTPLPMSKDLTPIETVTEKGPSADPIAQVSLDSLAAALIKGQKLNLSDMQQVDGDGTT